MWTWEALTLSLFIAQYLSSDVFFVQYVYCNASVRLCYAGLCIYTVRFAGCCYERQTTIITRFCFTVCLHFSCLLMLHMFGF